MKQREDTFQSMIVVLAVICAAAGLALGSAYRATRDRISAQQEQERIEALTVVLPDADKDGFREVSVPKSAPEELPAFAKDGKYYEAYDKPLSDSSGKLVGYALEAAGSGYGGAIRVTVGVDPKAEIVRGIKITFQQETPGLGTNCVAVKTEDTLWDVLLGKAKQSGPSEPWFQAQFRGKIADSFVKVSNKYENIDGLTGATITTNAVADAVVEAVKEFREKVVKSPAGSR